MSARVRSLRSALAEATTIYGALRDAWDEAARELPPEHEDHAASEAAIGRTLDRAASHAETLRVALTTARAHSRPPGALRAALEAVWAEADHEAASVPPTPTDAEDSSA